MCMLTSRFLCHGLKNTEWLVLSCWAADGILGREGLGFRHTLRQKNGRGVVCILGVTRLITQPSCIWICCITVNVGGLVAPWWQRRGMDEWITETFVSVPKRSFMWSHEDYPHYWPNSGVLCCMDMRFIYSHRRWSVDGGGASGDGVPPWKELINRLWKPCTIHLNRLPRVLSWFINNLLFSMVCDTSMANFSTAVMTKRIRFLSFRK